MTPRPMYMQIPVEEYEKLAKAYKDAEACQIMPIERWHRCDIPNEDGLYDLPAEPGEYIVEFVDKKGRSIVTSAEFDPDYSDWDCAPFDSEARQWREMPEPPEVK